MRPPEMKFSEETKRLAKEKVGFKCEICGKPETDDDRLECDHIIPIWWAVENPVFAPEVIRSLSNLQVVHHSCHLEKHKQENRQIYAELAPLIVTQYLETIINPRLDDWRDKLVEKYNQMNSKP